MLSSFTNVKLYQRCLPFERFHNFLNDILGTLSLSIGYWLNHSELEVNSVYIVYISHATDATAKGEIIRATLAEGRGVNP